MSTLTANQRYQHGTAENIGVLLVNLGTPTAPTAKMLRTYLRQFLSDRRVVEAPHWWWLPLLYCIIVPRRAPRSATAYQSVWTDQGSPLMVISRAQQQKLAAAFAKEPVVVELGMSYGKPSVASALQALQAQNCRRIVVLPLYPQYASSTVGSVFCDVTRELSKWRETPHMRFVSGYCDDPRYVTTLVDSIRTAQQAHGRPDKLIFSFHGTPLAMLMAGDPYHCWCHKTARLAATALGLHDNEWMTTFQSRFGPAKWLQPYTDETLKKLPAQGVHHVHVVCPAFASDCLETLEEIAIENGDFFKQAGGKQFHYLPALNDSPPHIDFLRDLIIDNINDWLQTVLHENAPDVRKTQQQAKEFMHTLLTRSN
ncbi:ferrochelatase [Candidatus Persebacteraceae bacterium Df01]|uniref:Ferrochelatase n=1 Tax=Candidatus Doriopsillibacter californiensis TaxID=2970740 RepID=A0ABT7QLY1_9GAMM|nr:ferrochelatase [Candidatus Persebacteraceae bacterium Df01]